MNLLDSRLRHRVALAVAVLLCAAAYPVSSQEEVALPGAPALDDSAGDSTRSARPIAVLPLTNRSGKGVPLKEIRDRLLEQLSLRGFDLLDEEDLEAFMRRHRMRYTAGLSPDMARALDSETESWAALIATVDLYDDLDPPKMGLTARLVTTEENPRIVWMDSAIRVGDQKPGGFDMGLISDLRVLESFALHDLASSAAGGRPASSTKARGRFRPAAHYASPDFPIIRDSDARIVVLPFANDSTTRHAGEILTDQLIRHLVEAGANVVEPGVTRLVMLEARQFYLEGPSIPETDILRLHLGTDVVVFGEVSRYEERLEPRQAQVEFMVRAIDTETGQQIWASSSFAGGNKGVYFFGAGQVHSAQALAAEMTRALVDTALRERAKIARKH